MRFNRSLLIGVLMLGLSASARAQDSPGGLPPPQTSESPAIQVYGKAPPGWGGVVTKMKLLAPGVGWAERSGRFYWTTDNGANWKDITPPGSSDLDEKIADFYFLDSHKGWALFSRFDKDESDEDKYEEPKFDLASTTDAGATWSRTHMALPPPASYRNPSRSPLSGWGGTIAFLDPLHGWMNITLPEQTMNTFLSFLLVTSDGGGTWSRASNAPLMADADMLLVTPSDGWMIGKSRLGEKELFVTHDGTMSWHQVLVDTPKEVLPATLASYYSLPTFEDSKHGFLEVSYRGGVGVKLATVLFATADGGRTWKADRMVTQEYDSRGYGRPVVVDSAWLFVSVSDHHPAIKTIGKGEQITANGEAATTVSRYTDAGELSFITAAQGWVIVDGKLLSTVDAGTTWTTLKLGPQPHVIQPHSSFTPSHSMSPVAAPTLENNQPTARAVGATFNTSKHLGFDTVETGTIDTMQKWWTFSPYYDAAIYLNFADNHTPQNDPNLDDDIWVSEVLAMGWGLIPIWVGLQAPPSSLQIRGDVRESFEIRACARFAIERGPREQLFFCNSLNLANFSLGAIYLGYRRTLGA